MCSDIWLISIFSCISRVASSGDTKADGYGRENEDLQHVLDVINWRRGVVCGSQLGELSELWTEGTWEGFMTLDDLYGGFLTLDLL